VVKQHSYGTVIRAIPDMRQVKKVNCKTLKKGGFQQWLPMHKVSEEALKKETL
jgi:hypothetical protein